MTQHDKPKDEQRTSTLAPGVWDKLLRLAVAAGNALDVDEPPLRMPEEPDKQKKSP